MARWMNDSFPEFHNDDTLWGYVIWAERQYRLWQRSDIKDVPFLWLMAMGVYDLEEPDTEMHQATHTIRYSAALVSRMFPQILWNKENIRKRGTSLFSYCTYPGLFYLIFDGSLLFGLLKIDGFGPTLYNDNIMTNNQQKPQISQEN